MGFLGEFHGVIFYDAFLIAEVGENFHFSERCNAAQDKIDPHPPRKMVFLRKYTALRNTKETSGFLPKEQKKIDHF